MTLEFDLKFPRRDFDLVLRGSYSEGITGIFGKSGSGKTSFFNLLAGLETPEEGYISLNGRVLTDRDNNTFVPVHKRRIGMVFQENRLFPHLSVKDNLLFGLPYVKKKKISLDKIVQMLELDSLLKSKPREISGGEQQRTAIGRALLTSPDLLLFDEPFNAIDYKLRSSLFPYLKGLEETLNIPILIISHDRDDLLNLTDRICVISKGREIENCRLFSRDIVKIS